MKFAAATSLIWDLIAAVRIAAVPTLKDILRNLSLLIRPHALSRTFMAHVWVAFGNPTDEGGRPVKQRLITPHASGVVLDIGAGHGHSVAYFDRSKVTKYIAVEPNVHMHPHIRLAANGAGYSESDGSLLILSCPAEDIGPYLRHESIDVDTLLFILVICSIPDPEKTITQITRQVLKPGGQLLFYEHVKSHRVDVAWWQSFWTPIWSLCFDGCRLDRPSHLWIKEMQNADEQGNVVGMWKEGETFGKPDEPEENLFWHQAGQFVKR